MAYKVVSFEDLSTPLTVEEIRTSQYSILERLGCAVSSWQPGAVVRTILAAIAPFHAAYSAQAAQIASYYFLDYAIGGWLDLVAWYVFGVRRIGATFATGEATLTNSGGGVYTVDVGDLIITNPTIKKAYRNTVAFTLGVGPSAVTIPIEAIEEGAASTSPPNTITELTTTLLGVTVTNASAVVGDDEETDEELRTRCREKLNALSPNGPRAAYSYFAKSAVRADGTPIGVNRVRVAPNTSTGQVDVTVCTATGVLSSDDLAAVENTLYENVVPLCVVANVQNATPLSIPVTYSVWAHTSSGVSQTTLQNAIQNALTNFMAAQDIGGNIISGSSGYVYADAIRTAIGAAHPSIFHVSLTAPSEDVAVSSTQVPVLGTITPTAINIMA